MLSSHFPSTKIYFLDSTDQSNADFDSYTVVISLRQTRSPCWEHLSIYVIAYSNIQNLLPLSLEFILRDIGWPIDSVIVMGRSIGCFSALELASQYPNLGGIALISPFANLQIVVEERVGLWLSQYLVDPLAYNNIERIKKVFADTLIIHGKIDQVLCLFCFLSCWLLISNALFPVFDRCLNTSLRVHTTNWLYFIHTFLWRIRVLFLLITISCLCVLPTNLPPNLKQVVQFKSSEILYECCRSKRRTLIQPQMMHHNTNLFTDPKFFVEPMLQVQSNLVGRD